MKIIFTLLNIILSGRDIYFIMRVKDNISEEKRKLFINFTTAGAGGIIGWIIVHPFNTVALRMNLLQANNTSAVKPSLLPIIKEIIAKDGAKSLYSGLSAGIVRQIFYATSRFGLFEVMRDQLAKYRETDLFSRLFVGVLSGGIAAYISCPAEVSLVRMSNDKSLPVEQRRNYKGVSDAAIRIIKEEGVSVFWRGSVPFVNRAMVVGAVQVATYDQFRSYFATNWGVNGIKNSVLSAMISGFLYAATTMPLETAKNRMAFQKADPVTNQLLYRSTIQTMKEVVKRNGIKSLWTGFLPYYARCGGHTVFMFLSVEALRRLFY